MGPRRHLVKALVDDAEALSEFFHAAEIAIVAVAIHTDRHVELDSIVGVVRLALAHVPWYTAAAKHDAGEAVVKSFSGSHDADSLCSAFPDPVVCQEFFGFIDSVAELGRPLVDIV